MKKAALEKVYLTVMSVCLVCCLTLLGSVVRDRPLFQPLPAHAPVLRTVSAEELSALDEQNGGAEETAAGIHGGYLLTEDYLEEMLGSCLPESFPSAEIDVTLREPNIRLKIETRRDELRRYLQSCGMQFTLRQNLAFCLLPKELEAETVFSVSARENGLNLLPVALTLGEKQIDLNGLPTSVFDTVNRAVNGLLQAAGVSFGSVKFLDEGLLLE